MTSHTMAAPDLWHLCFYICILRYIKLNIYIIKLIQQITLSSGYQRFPDSYIFVIYKQPLKYFDYLSLPGPNEI